MRLMAPLPEFDSPPVVETVLSVSFSPLQGFTAAHGGAFWERHLREYWSASGQAPPMPVQIERLDEEGLWRSRGPALILEEIGTDVRLQFVDAQHERMVQMQSSALAYNWRRREADYPSFAKLYPEFDGVLGTFSSYVVNAGFPALALSQWEVTYVNRIFPGNLWKVVPDWDSVLPGIMFVPNKSEGGVLESMGMNWVVRLDENRGRLRVTISHGRDSQRDRAPFIDLRLVARGPIDEGADLRACMEVGHEAIVRTFSAITSEQAHKDWGKR